MTTKNDIREWFDSGRKNDYEFMLVVCDTFDYEDYPCYAKGTQQFMEKYNDHNGVNMQKIVEVYDLSMDRETQLAEERSSHSPEK